MLEVLVPKINLNLQDQRKLAMARKWVAGISEHNHIDDECCLDHSCCHPEQYIEDHKTRIKMFWSWYNRKFAKQEGKRRTAKVTCQGTEGNKKWTK